MQIVLALYFATVLSFNTRFRNLFKGVLFFPYLINGVAIALHLPLLLPARRHPRLRPAAASACRTQHLWLGDPDTGQLARSPACRVWRYLGLNFVLFLGAIQSIPAELYEAAELDGANRWHQFRYIIVPGIRRVISLSVHPGDRRLAGVFEIPYIMTGGANGSADVRHPDRQARRSSSTRSGSPRPLAVVLLVIILVVTWIQRRARPRRPGELA